MKNAKLLVPNMFSVLIFKHIFSNLPLNYKPFQVFTCSSMVSIKKLFILLQTLPKLTEPILRIWAKQHVLKLNLCNIAVYSTSLKQLEWDEIKIKVLLK